MTPADRPPQGPSSAPPSPPPSPRQGGSDPPDQLASASNLRCTICGLVIQTTEAPAHCPECGALAYLFEPSDEAPHAIAHNPFQPRDRSDQYGELLGPGGGGCVVDD